MDPSEMLAVEYNPRRREWRTEPLGQRLEENYGFFLRTLRANYKYFVEADRGHEYVDEVELSALKQSFGGRPVSESHGWILLGLASSSEDADALVMRFEGLKEAFLADIAQVEAREVTAP